VGPAFGASQQNTARIGWRPSRSERSSESCLVGFRKFCKRKKKKKKRKIKVRGVAQSKEVEKGATQKTTLKELIRKKTRKGFQWSLTSHRCIWKWRKERKS
jgi:hypothetical protein